ncbi:hypothetical protein JZ751_010378 [Albula glossodonta]|uniref:C2H2-type domain-containing protein n=1 Tax=Albula glossodonta TaxID=121402 RepID=A0A8T2P509_9TELE|nr:hypothetical protein JZ751_010378 [Albula glossodonta]
MKQMVRACQDPSWDGEGAAHSLNVAASPHKHSGGRVEPPASHTRESPPLRDKGRSASCHKPSPPETQLPPIKEEASLPDAEVSGYGLGTPTRGGQDFACKECPYTTNNSYNLNCHARTHNGERPYECSDCVCCFRTRSALNRHKRSQTCQRPRGGAAPKPLPRVKAEPQVVQCSDCKYSTSNAYNMKLHQRIHTDERPYACSKCDAAFRTQSHLYRHERCHRRSRDRAESLP